MAGFADESVGGVCGNKKYRSVEGEDATEEGENLYWRLDKWEKQLESSIGSIFAADGAIYALRRELFVPIEDLAQADDIAYSSRVVLQGYRLIFEPRAIAWEPPPKEGRDEFRRKVRVTNHSVRALLNLGSALWNRGFYSFELLSHKLVRHFIPLLLLLLLVTNLLLAESHPLFQLTLIGQLLFYLLGWLGFLLRHRRLGRARVFSVPYFFCLANSAALFGILSIWRGDRHAVWQPRGGGR
jgi:cellulose synthase/poly-beta-1,6-N-acetylglucosamine synthase-like glycosyltransferase